MSRTATAVGRRALVALGAYAGCALAAGCAAPAVERPALEAVAVEDGLELAFEQVGSGERVLVVPARAWLARDLDHLAERWPGWTLVFYDLRGRGASSAIEDEGRLGIERDVRDLERLRAALAIERMSLLGWSYHGGVCARYALAHPARVERLVLVAPMPPRREPHWERYLERAVAALDPDALASLERDRRDGLPTHDPARFCRRASRVFLRAMVADPSAVERMRSEPCAPPNEDFDRASLQSEAIIAVLGRWDWRAELAALETPTLVVQGDADALPAESAAEWAEAVPDARLELLAGVGHLPWLEAPEPFTELVGAFLDAAPAPAGM